MHGSYFILTGASSGSRFVFLMFTFTNTNGINDKMLIACIQISNLLL